MTESNTYGPHASEAFTYAIDQRISDDAEVKDSLRIEEEVLLLQSKLSEDTICDVESAEITRLKPNVPSDVATDWPFSGHRLTIYGAFGVSAEKESTATQVDYYEKNGEVLKRILMIVEGEVIAQDGQVQEVNAINSLAKWIQKSKTRTLSSGK